MKFGKALASILIIIMLLGTSVMVAGCIVDNSFKNQEQQIAELENQISLLKERIDGLEKDLGKGKFFTLAHAYGNGWLNKEDLRTIADYYYGVVPCEEKLDDDVANAIKQAWAAKLVEDGRFTEEKASKAEVVIHEYYGTYNKCVMVLIDCGEHYPDVYVPINVEIGGITFTFQEYGPSFAVWRM